MLCSSFSKGCNAIKSLHMINILCQGHSPEGLIPPPRSREAPEGLGRTRFMCGSPSPEGFVRSSGKAGEDLTS